MKEIYRDISVGLVWLIVVLSAVIQSKYKIDDPNSHNFGITFFCIIVAVIYSTLNSRE
jgi:hypothetical protein